VTGTPDKLFRAAFDAQLAHLAILGGGGEILEVNRAWTSYAAANGGAADATAPGANYFDVCRGASGSSSAQAPSAMNGIKAILTGQDTLVEFDYPCHSPDEQRWFRFQATPLREGRARVLVSHHDVSVSRGLLSPREREILGHVAAGLTSAEIAETLHLAHSTVETHVRNAINKLDARSRANAVLLALRQGELAPASALEAAGG
jgi:DNA-binding CsgD family transcriptional regulator